MYFNDLVIEHTIKGTLNEIAEFIITWKFGCPNWLVEIKFIKEKKII